MPVWPAGFINVVRVMMPNKQAVQVAVRNDMTVRDILISSCEVCRVSMTSVSILCVLYIVGINP